MSPRAVLWLDIATWIGLLVLGFLLPFLWSPWGFIIVVVAAIPLFMLDVWRLRRIRERQRLEQDG